jgi:hypothetical protein
MISKRVASVAVVGLFLLGGCDDRVKTSATSSTHAADAAPRSVVVLPATDPAPAVIAAAHSGVDDPATKPAEPPHSTFFMADGRASQPVAFNFPRARLHIDREQKTAVLYSDDPKNAIDAKYVGNGYYIVVPLTDDALEHLDHYQWHFKAVSSDHQDSADGIFLEGQRWHLQPQDIVVTFAGEAPLVNVTVEGMFSEFDMTQNTLEGKLVPVKGNFSALVDTSK